MINPPKLFSYPSKKYVRMLGFLSPQILPRLSNVARPLDFKNQTSEHDFFGYTYFIFRPAAYYFFLLVRASITLAIFVELGHLTHQKKLLITAVILAPLRWYRYQSLEFHPGSQASTNYKGRLYKQNIFNSNGSYNSNIKSTIKPKCD